MVHQKNSSISKRLPERELMTLTDLSLALPAYSCSTDVPCKTGALLCCSLIPTQADLTWESSLLSNKLPRLRSPIQRSTLKSFFVSSPERRPASTRLSSLLVLKAFSSLLWLNVYSLRKSRVTEALTKCVNITSVFRNVFADKYAQYCGNVAMKVHCKLGGVTHQVKHNVRFTLVALVLLLISICRSTRLLCFAVQM